MNGPSLRNRVCGSARPAAWAALVVLGCFPLANPAGAAPAEGPRVAAGRLVTPTASLLRRQAPDGAWEPCLQQREVYSRDQLLALPGERAGVDSGNGAVRLVLWGNLPEVSPLPVAESAVVLQDNPDYDLDVTLDRGRVAFISTKEKDPARVRVRAQGESWVLTLAERGDVAALELYGRWPRGAPFNPKGTDRPTQDLSLLILRGAAELRAGGDLFALRSPPGPAYFHWNSADGRDPGPRRLEKLPAWAEPGAGQTTEARRVGVALARLRGRLREEPVGKALAALRASADKEEDKAQAATGRELAVFSYGAVDDLRGLLSCLTDPKHPGVRENAVAALRQWIGRGPGQDLKVYDFLVKEEKYPAAQAETVVQLLHTPFQADSPETYEMLIDYLRSNQLAIRELARWHLYRLAPAGKDIAYDAAGTEEQRQSAYQKWKALIPSGKLPPAPKPSRK